MKRKFIGENYGTKVHRRKLWEVKVHPRKIRGETSSGKIRGRQFAGKNYVGDSSVKFVRQKFIGKIIRQTFIGENYKAKVH